MLNDLHSTFFDLLLNLYFFTCSCGYSDWWSMCHCHNKYCRCVGCPKVLFEVRVALVMIISLVNDAITSYSVRTE